MKRSHLAIAGALLPLAAAATLLALAAPAGVGPRLLVALAAAWAALQLLLHEALALAAARGAECRREVLDQFARRLADGRFDAIASPLPSLWRDPELLALRAELRALHEERARVQRLLAALRASETERTRRDAIDALRDAVDADDAFADGELPLLPPPVPQRRPVRAPLAAAALLMALAWALAGGGLT